MMNKTLRLSLILIFVLMIAFTVSIRNFEPDEPENTIRILIEKPLEPDHFRIRDLIQEDHYRYRKIGEDFELIPPLSINPTLRFLVVRDENTRALHFLKGDGDLIYDALSIAKTEWIRKKMNTREIRILSSRGESISYLALKDPEIAERIRTALPVQEWSKHVFSNWVEPEPFQKTESSNLNKKDFPSTVHYLTTSSREGQQLAHLTREALGKIGIHVEIHVYENSLFYTHIRNRQFDLYSSTGIQGFKSILDLPGTTLIPLFRWKHGLILSSRVRTPNDLEKSLDYSFRFLSKLHLESSP